MEKWKILFHRFEVTKNNLYEKIEFKSNQDYVYIIQEDKTNRFKIGWTTNPDIEGKRLSQMQTGNSKKLRLIFSFSVSSKAIEYAIHNHFRDSNIHREWFELTESDISNLKSQDWRTSMNFT